MIRYIYITERAKKLAQKLSLLEGNKFKQKEKIKIEKKYMKNNGEENSTNKYVNEVISYKDFKKNSVDIFKQSDFLIFIMATGIVVRAIAPLLKNKFEDPGVIVIDEMGSNVISLLSGHIGGANEKTIELAKKINANPVITTATDVNEVGSLDMICKKMNIDVKKIRNLILKTNLNLVEGKRVCIYVEEDYYRYLGEELKGFEVYKNIEDLVYYEFNYMKGLDSELNSNKNINQLDINNVSNFDTANNRLEVDNLESLYYDRCSNAKDGKQDIFIAITHKKSEIELLKKYNSNYSMINILIPRLCVLGVGCRRNTPYDLFEMSIKEYLSEVDVVFDSIYELGSINIKEDENCIQIFSSNYNIKTKFFDVESLKKVEYRYEGSDFVKRTVGVSSVSQTACDLLCGGNVLKRRYAKNGVTVSLGININDEI